MSSEINPNRIKKRHGCVREEEFCVAAVYESTSLEELLSSRLGR